MDQQALFNLPPAEPAEPEHPSCEEFMVRPVILAKHRTYKRYVCGRPLGHDDSSPHQAYDPKTGAVIAEWP
jgi:hypothetical protein